MTLLIISVVSAVYLSAGFLSWLISAVEMLGDTSNNLYLDRLSKFSRLNVATEVLTFLYLTLGWPVHQALKAAFKS